MFYDTTTENNFFFIISERKRAENIRTIVLEGQLITWQKWLCLISISQAPGELITGNTVAQLKAHVI